MYKQVIIDILLTSFGGVIIALTGAWQFSDNKFRGKRIILCILYAIGLFIINIDL